MYIAAVISAILILTAIAVLSFGLWWCNAKADEALPDGWYWLDRSAYYALIDAEHQTRAIVEVEHHHTFLLRRHYVTYYSKLANTRHRSPEAAMRRATRAVVR